MRLIIILAVFVQIACLPAFAGSSLSDIWNIPSGEVSAKTARSYFVDSIRVEEVYYHSLPYKGKPVNIFGYFCYPAAKVHLPAILLVHGGGGTASLGRSVAWAKRGYAVLTIDLPGKGDKRGASRSGGPDMDVPILLRTNPADRNYLVHAVAAARNAITYLTQRKEVDPERIGMVGLSWGGVITLLTNGQDARLKTAVNVFGAGYIPEGCTWQDRFDMMTKEETDTWYSYLDPKNFLKTQHAPILFITGTNDHCYYLPTFQKSFDEVSVPKKLILLPNLRHRFLPYMQSIAWSWLDSKLKNGGSFPEIELLEISKKGEDKIIIAVSAISDRKIEKTTLYYTHGEPSHWTTKNWKSLDAYFENGVYYFGIPVSLLNPEILFFVNAKDGKGAAASTPVRSLFKVNFSRGKSTFALSSPIKKIHTHQSPLQILGFKGPISPYQIYYSKKEKSYHLIEIKKSGPFEFVRRL